MYLLHGYFGYGNYGDELLAKLCEQKILAKDPTARFFRLSSKNSLGEHINAIKNCNEFISLGGLFQDKTSIRSLFYYAANILLARLFRKKIKVIAQGLGPIKSPISRFLSYIALKQASHISVRDKASSLMLKDWNIDHYYGSDLAWLINYQEDKISEEFKSNTKSLFIDLESGPLQREKLLAISLRENEGQNDLGLIEKIIESLPKNYKDKPILILQMHSQDIKIHRLFNEVDFKKRKTRRHYLIEADRYSAEEIIYILKRYCSHIIGMRLHALILAKLAGLDLTAIDCDPKIKELQEQLDLYSVEKLQERAKQHLVHL